MSPIIKRNCSLPDHPPLVLCFLLACMTIGGCFTRTEGCLDIAAENFDLNADRSCDTCCTYPPISISLSQKWQDVNFNTDSIYTDVNGDSFKIRDLKYFLSSFSWTDAGDVVYSIDSTDIMCGPQTIRYTPDIIQVDSRQFSYILDTIRLFPSIQSLEFKLGTEPVLECVDESAENTPVVLSDKSPLWDTLVDSRAAIRLVLQRDLTSEILDTIYVHTCQSIELNFIEEFQLGKPEVLKLTVNYALWFANADVSDIHSFNSSILAGLPGSFSKTPE